MIHTPTPAEIGSLLAKNDPEDAWVTALSIARRINPGYDSALARIIFDDVMRLFHGEYPGYCPIKTLYHNLPHTLAVFFVRGEADACCACFRHADKRR